MSNIFAHTVLGFCWWDIPAAIVLIAVIVVFIVRSRKLKQEKEELEDQLADFEVQDMPEAPGSGL
ncbi:MAG: hypothetical protein HUJ79_03635 [Firmicutes bacterium]|nr:hypothetical protein [Bacillota bacterium]